MVQPRLVRCTVQIVWSGGIDSGSSDATSLSQSIADYDGPWTGVNLPVVSSGRLWPLHLEAGGRRWSRALGLGQGPGVRAITPHCPSERLARLWSSCLGRRTCRLGHAALVRVVDLPLGPCTLYTSEHAQQIRRQGPDQRTTEFCTLTDSSD